MIRNHELVTRPQLIGGTLPEERLVPGVGVEELAGAVLAAMGAGLRFLSLQPASETRTPAASTRAQRDERERLAVRGTVGLEHSRTL